MQKPTDSEPSAAADGYPVMDLPLDGNLPIPMAGTPTGLRDSNGNPIRVGDRVKMEVTGNRQVHGDWSIYQVVCRGLIPVLSYRISEKGQIFPEDYTGSRLADYYDQESLLWATNLSTTWPEIQIEVVAG